MTFGGIGGGESGKAAASSCSRLLDSDDDEFEDVGPGAIAGIGD